MKKFNFILVFLLLFIPIVVFAIDTDQDGLSDEWEKYYYTDVNNPDTDGDGYLDGQEIKKDYSPHLGEGAMMHESDYDEDGLNDWLERWFGSDMGNQDTDADSFFDYEEVMNGFSPTDPAPLRKFVRRVEVDRTYQRLNYYVDNVKLLNFPVSTGNPVGNSETPEGEFEITKKIENKSYIGPDYNLPGVKWNLQFLPMYYIHTAYWHNDFGVKTHSHGCVNLRESDAELLYKYVDIGTSVTVTGTTPVNYYVKN